MKYVLFLILMVVSGFIFSPFVKSHSTLQVLRINMKKQPKTLDPRRSMDIYSSQMQYLLFEGLVKLYPDQSVKLAQAKAYEVSEDKLTYIFYLKRYHLVE